ncbi:MAG: molybdopterin-binding oxidoreductase [Anaerolineaceae bacterium]|nr:molybdopterin-binding oxidoreductase [Anaerolineaceae bacterium]
MNSKKVKIKYVVRGFFYGLLSIVVLIVVSYLGMVWLGLPFLPFRLFDFLTRILPGAMITFVIDSMVSIITSLQIGSTSAIAKLTEQGIAIFQFLIIGGLVGALIGYLRSKIDIKRLPLWGTMIGLGLGLGLFLVEIYLIGFSDIQIAEIVWIIILMTVWGLVLGWINLWVSQKRSEDDLQEGISRREVLTLIAAAFAALLTSGLAFLIRSITTQDDNTVTEVKEPTPIPDEELQNRIQPVSGTRSEITSNEDFYRIDINTQVPEINGEEWHLVLDGLVNNPMQLSIEDIRSRPKHSQYITLSCISNKVGGDLISASLWAGIRLKDLLEEAGLQTGAGELAIESVDGFYESVSIEDMMDPRTLLVYEMNGQPLPQEHGYPLRIYIPNRYGMKQPKWITHMEVIKGEGDGYWVDRGWSEEAFVRLTSVIDEISISENGNGMLLAGGIAYAGARGINKVEIKVDDGSWQEAELRVPPLSDLTWVQWRYETQDITPGEHVATVRAYDGNGDPQIMEVNPPHPSGATGYDTFTFEV